MHYNLKSPYKPEIDGLRAISITAVLMYHAFPNLLPGGFVGVDLFFVISGYLVTSTIVREIENSNFNFIVFIKKRIIRIFPALLVVLLATLVLGALLLTSQELFKLSEHTIASLALIQNFVLASENSYFDVKSNSKPLLHIWSLSVEEQFYLLIPTLLIITSHLKINRGLIIIALAMVSFLYSLNATNAYFSSFARFWEILTGAAIAQIPLQLNISHKNQNRLQLLGLLIITYSLLTATKDNFPGIQTTLPIIGTIILLSFKTSDSYITKILSSNIATYIGKISYPLYLWHWPLLSFMFILGEDRISAKILILSISLVLATLTFEYVEKPTRYLFTQNPKGLRYLWSGVISIVITSILLIKNEGLPSRYPSSKELVEAKEDWLYPGTMDTHQEDSLYYHSISNTKPTVLFVGDSNMEQYYPRIHHAIKSNPHTSKSAVFLTAGGCNPIPDYLHPNNSRHCNNLLYRGMKELLTRNPHIDTVVLAALWSKYIGTDIDGIQQVSALKKLIQEVSEKSKIIVILEIPTGSSFAPDTVIKRDLRNFPDVFTVNKNSVDVEDLSEKYSSLRSLMLQELATSKATLIDPLIHMCPGRICNPLTKSLTLKYKDGTHLRSSFVASQVDFLDHLVRDNETEQVPN